MIKNEIETLLFSLNYSNFRSKISKVGDVVGNVRDGASRVGSGVLDMLSPTGGDGEGHVKKSSTSTERFNLLRDLKASVHEVVTSEFREEKINTENHPCVFKLCVDVERVCFYRLHRVGSFWVSVFLYFML